MRKYHIQVPKFSDVSGSCDVIYKHIPAKQSSIHRFGKETESGV